MQGWVSFRVGIVSGILALSASSCGLGLFSKDDANRKVDERAQYRQLRPECQGVDLGNATLDAPGFRKLLRCFNANGSIPELQALVEEASDAELRPVLDLLNVGFLGETQTLAASRELLNDLEAKGELESRIRDLGGFLADPARLRAILSFIDPGETSKRLQIGPDDRAAVAKFVADLDPIAAQEFLRIFRLAIDSPAAREWMAQAQPMTEEQRRSLALALSRFARTAGHRGGAVDILRILLADSRWKNFKSLLAWGQDREAILRRVEELSALTSELKNFWPAFEKLDSLLAKPVSCLDGALVFQDPWKAVEKELQNHRSDLPEFMIRFGSLTALYARPFCEVPLEAFVAYPKVLRIFDTPGSALLTEAFQATLKDGAFGEARRLLSAHSATWIPLLETLEETGATERLFLAASSLDPAATDWLAQGLANRLRDGSVEQTLNWFSRLNTAQWESHFQLWNRLLQGDVGPWSEGLGAMDAFFSDTPGAHPWFEGWKRIALRSLEGDIETVGLGSLAERKSFDRAVKLLHKMTQDGRAASLFHGIVRLVARERLRTETRETGSLEVRSKTPRDFSLRHELTSEDLGGRARASVAAKLRPCLSLRLDASIALQLESVRGCEGKSRDLESWQSALQALEGKRTRIQGRELSLLELLEKEVSVPRGTKEEKVALVRSLKSGIADGSFNRALDGIRFFVLGNGSQKGVLTDALRVAQSGGPSGLIGEWVDEFGRFWNRPEAAGVLALIRNASGRASPLPSREIRYVADRERLARWVGNKECVSDPATRSVRVKEIIDDYEQGIVGWERAKLGDPGRSRRYWTESELQARLAPALKRLRGSDLQKGIERAFESFRLLPGEKRTRTRRWTPAEVMAFFENRSKDPQAMAYLFSGESALSVRVMSSLDRLESLLAAANFTFPYFERGRLRRNENFALKFMGLIAESWGDSPRELWPLEVQRKYPAPARPKTQREAYEEILGFLKTYTSMGGLPKTRRCEAVADPRDPREVQEAETWEPTPTLSAPDWLVSDRVKANLYNLMRALPVIEENLPDSGHRHAGGMLFLRDLFYEIHSTVPDESRDPARPESHGLGLITDLSDVGFLRAFSYFFSRVQDSGERAALTAALGAVSGWIAEAPPGRPTLLRSMLSLSEGEIRNWIGQLFRRSVTGSATEDAFFASVYLAAEAARLGIDRDLAPILGDFFAEGWSTSVREWDSWTDWVLTRRTAEFLRGLYLDSREGHHRQAAATLRSILTTAQSKHWTSRAVRTFWLPERSRNEFLLLLARIEEVRGSSEFRRMDPSAQWDALLRFLEGSAITRRRIGDLLQGDFAREMVRVCENDPASAERIGRGIFDAVASTRMDEFLEFFERLVPH